MNSTQSKPKGVHLVGSVNLENSRAVFTLVSEILGQHIRRLPDGETGERRNWIRWQMELIQHIPQLEMATLETSLPGLYGQLPPLRVRPGVEAEELQFPPLGYSAAAIASYAEFKRLKRDGVVPEPVRFQVSLPTPLAPIHSMVMPESQPEVEAAYQKRMLTELEEILAEIPAQELAIQWDTAVEFAILEGLMPTYLTKPKEQILDRLVHLGNQVPTDVELGYHLCYGDAGHKHFMEPQDTSKLVAIANGISARLSRPLNWIHMPVPRSRSDLDYFRPLAAFKLASPTELYLGLIHLTDGVPGALRRIQAAQQVVTDFGVATECGLGRRPSETIPEVLKIHAEAAAPIR